MNSPGDRMAGVEGKDRPEGAEAGAGPSADDDDGPLGICTFWHCVFQLPSSGY